MTVTGPAAVQGPASPFSLQAVHPMPEELRAVCPGGRTIGDKYVRAWRETSGPDGKNVPVEIPEETRAAWRERHGADNWYAWALDHWGTKWDIEDASVEEAGPTQVTYEFDTAWSPPEPVCRKLREQFPALHIAWFYDEPGSAMAAYL